MAPTNITNLKTMKRMSSTTVAKRRSTIVKKNKSILTHGGEPAAAGAPAAAGDSSAASLIVSSPVTEPKSAMLEKEGLLPYLVDKNLDVLLSAPDEDGEATANIATVWRARFLLIIAAGLYGTNFTFVKILGDIMPVSVSSTARFGLATLVTLPWLLKMPSSAGAETRLQKEASWKAMLVGLEVGIWNSIGYYAQAVGLETTYANKVSLKNSSGLLFHHGVL
jgi:hypothetical protein